MSGLGETTDDISLSDDSNELPSERAKKSEGRVAKVGDQDPDH